MIHVNGWIRIPLREIELTYARSSGPGGQNVNKVNSKAVLRWNLRESPSLREEDRARLLARLGPRLTREGEVLIASDRFRDQARNREDCLERLRELLSRAARDPIPRKATRPTRSSVRRNLESKRRESAKKRLRGRPGREE